MTDDENVLIHLRRNYGKDEMVSYVVKRMRELKVELGQANAEIDHLTAQLALKEVNKDINKEAKIEVKKEELWKELRAKVTSLEKSVRKLRIDNSELITKLVNKNNV